MAGFLLPKIKRAVDRLNAHSAPFCDLWDFENQMNPGASSTARAFSPEIPFRGQPEGSRSMPGRAASEAPRFVPRPVDIPQYDGHRAASEGPQHTFRSNANQGSHLRGCVNGQPEPLRGKSPSNHSRDRTSPVDRGSFHDTARSRLNEQMFFEDPVYPQEQRFPGQAVPPQQQDNWERLRVTLYRRPHSPGSRDSNNSMRTAHPRNHGRSGSRRKPRSRDQSKENSKPVSPLMAKLQEKKSGLEKIVTPLRLGLLLGCFDMIGGSLSAWMTYKRFGAAAQAAEAAKQAAISQQQTAQQNSKGRSRSRRRNRYRDEAPEYDEDSESDSEYDERQRRVAEHIMSQHRLDRGRSRRH